MHTTYSHLERNKEKTNTQTNKKKHTKLFQRGHPKLVIMVVTGGCGTFLDNLRCDRLGRELHSIHTVDEGLKALVRKRRLTIIELYDPVGKKNVKRESTHFTNTICDNTHSFKQVHYYATFISTNSL